MSIHPHMPRRAHYLITRLCMYVCPHRRGPQTSAGLGVWARICSRVHSPCTATGLYLLCSALLCAVLLDSTRLYSARLDSVQQAMYIVCTAQEEEAARGHCDVMCAPSLCSVAASRTDRTEFGNISTARFGLPRVGFVGLGWAGLSWVGGGGGGGQERGGPHSGLTIHMLRERK